MDIKVGINSLKIQEQDTLNAGEYNIHKCNFEFDDVYEGLVKKAVFSDKEHSYQMLIENNACIIPYEILQKSGDIEIGLYAYEVEDEELVLRYSPKPITKYINIGSYKEHYDNYEEITPTDKQQIEQELTNISNQMDNLNIEAEKVDTTTTITITHKDGTTEEVEILDGAKGDKGDKGEPGAIKMLIVAELPTTGEEDTIYLVPLEVPDVSGNNYAEYVYINGAWELLGKIGVQVDLTDYVKNNDYATNQAGGVIKISNTFGTGTDNGYLYATVKNFSDYSSGSNSMLLSKGTLENVINGKGLVSNTDYASESTGGVFKTNTAFATYIENTYLKAGAYDYATYQGKSNNMFISKGTLENVIAGKDLTTKTYVDNIVGDIESILEELDIGGGV